MNDYSIRENANAELEYWFDITDAMKAIFGECISKAEIRMFTIAVKHANSEADTLLHIYNKDVTAMKKDACELGKFNHGSKWVELSFNGNEPILIRGTNWELASE